MRTAKESCFGNNEEIKQFIFQECSEKVNEDQ